MILVSYFLSTGSIVPRNGTFTLRPSRGALVFACGIFLSTVAIVYVMARASEGQEVAAWLVGIFFVFCSLYTFYTIFMCHYSFDTNQISFEALGRKPKVIPWSNLVESAVADSTIEGTKLIFRHDIVLKLSRFLDGLDQLNNCVLAHLHAFNTEKPIAECHDDYFKSLTVKSIAECKDDCFNSLVGTLLLLRICYVDINLEIGKVSQLAGTVETVNSDHLFVRLDSDKGAVFKLPRISKAFIKVDVEDDISPLHQTDDKGPLIISEWYTTDSSWA